MTNLSKLSFKDLSKNGFDVQDVQIIQNTEIVSKEEFAKKRNLKVDEVYKINVGGGYSVLCKAYQAPQSQVA